MTRPGSWFPDTLPEMNAAVARRALLDVGVCEDPPSSNRAPEIDEYVRRVGSPPGSPWCAAAVAAWFREAGAALPPKDAGATNAWLKWAKEHGLWSTTPTIGAAVVYGKDGHAEHIGVVVRISPVLMTAEGNTSLDATQSREGIAVDLKLRQGSTWILGYIRPVKAVG